MKPIGQIFDELAQNYHTLLKSVESMESIVAYAPLDFFQLEPFYHLIYRIRAHQCNFYPTPEELPPESDIHLCLLTENRLIFARQSFSATVHCDSFFEYEGEMRVRSIVYINDEEIKPVSVERLIKKEDGHPRLFESSGMYGYLRVEYNREEDTIIGKKYSGLNADNSSFISELSIHISPESGSIEKILEKHADNKECLIYEKSHLEKKH